MPHDTVSLQIDPARALGGLIVGVILILAAPTRHASAQPSEALGIWTHNFEEQDRRVYLELTGRTLRVWSIQNRTDCIMYPSQISWEEGVIKRQTGDWNVTVSGDEMTVEFPTVVVEYQRTDDDPRERCFDSGEDI